MPNSINTNIAAYYAQSNISLASRLATASVARLSSGNRIVSAADDVAALANGTLIATNVSTLRSALTTAAQGTSLLQVADGALAQITSILQQQNSLANQAGSGNLTNSDRALLDLQFQALKDEIDRLAGATNFNGVNLLDGSLSASALVQSVSNNATRSSISLTFNSSDNIVADETVIINGVTLTAKAAPANGKEFLIGATLAETVQNLADRLNTIATNNTLVDGTLTAANQLALAGAKYEAQGTALVITSRAGGSLSQSFAVSLLGTATVNGEASLNGSYGGSSFNLFATGDGFSSATSDVSDDTAATATPFDIGNSLTVTINGVTKTLFTFTSGGGLGTATDNYTLKQLVDGINANAGDTGVRAALVYDGTEYNVRLNYDGLAGSILLNGGDGFVSASGGTGHNLAGTGIDLSAGTTTLSGTDTTKSVVFTRFANLFDSNGLTGVTNITTTVAAAAPTSADTTTPFKVGDVIRITVNGEQRLLHTIASGDGLDDIIAGINSRTAQTGVYAALTGASGSYNIQLFYTEFSDASVVTGNNDIAVTAGAGLAGGATLSGTTEGTTTGATLSQSVRYGLRGGADDGLGFGDTLVTGAVGDSLLTSLSQTRAEVFLIFTQNATAAQTLTVGGKTFTFTANSSTTNRSPDEILIGATLKETLDNAISAIRNYAQNYAVGSEAYELNQISITREGDNLAFRARGNGPGNVYQIDGTTASNVNTSVTGASRTNSGNLTNAATTYGVSARGVTNSAFQGTLNGFNVTYKSTDTVDISITVGRYTYTAQNVDLTVSSNTGIRLVSNTLADGTNGGYFDLQLAANEVTGITDQVGADVIETRLNSAFSSLSFIQKRNVSSYTGGGSIVVGSTTIGSLIGTSVRAQLASYDNLRIQGISVSAPSGSNTDANITVTIGGVKYSTGVGLTSTLGANQTFKLVSEADPNQFLEFTTGTSSISISSSDRAKAVENALKQAFGFVAGSAALSFQIGSASTDKLSVSIASVLSSDLYAGADLDITTQENAAAASATTRNAIVTATAVRATVGALLSRFTYASNALGTSIQNQDAARSELLDTDIARESTDYATAQVKLQAGISVLAQANQQLQSLLKLIG